MLRVFTGTFLAVSSVAKDQNQRNNICRIFSMYFDFKNLEASQKIFVVYGVMPNILSRDAALSIRLKPGTKCWQNVFQHAEVASMHGNIGRHGIKKTCCLLLVSVYPTPSGKHSATRSTRFPRKQF